MVLRILSLCVILPKLGGCHADISEIGIPAEWENYENHVYKCWNPLLWDTESKVLPYTPFWPWTLYVNTSGKGAVRYNKRKMHKNREK